LDEFKKSKPPIFDGELEKLKDANEWLHGMKNFFGLHDYTKNMKDRIAIFSLIWK